MLAILILSVSFSVLVSDAMLNDLVAAGQKTMAPQNVMSPFFNYNLENTQTPGDGVANNPRLGPLEVAATPQNPSDCPNTAILLNILNILTNSLPSDGKTTLEPEKFKYVLTIVKNFIETTPLTPGNVELYNKFKNLEAQLITINGIEKYSLRDFNDKLRAKMSLQYDWPAQSNSNCHDMLSNLIQFINTAYAQVLRYCLTTDKCNMNNANIFPYVYNGVKPNVPIQRNLTTNIWPVHETLPKESITAGADLVNFIKNQEGKGINNIMSILQNYRPRGVTNVPGNDANNPNGVQNPLLHMNPGNIQVPSSYPPINEINGKNPNLQPNNIYRPPNINTAPWQSVFSGLKGLSGDARENLQYAKFFTQKLYEENNLGVSSSINPGVEKPSYLVNGPIAPIQTGISNADPKEMVKNNPSINKSPNLLIDHLIQYPNQQKNLLTNTNINIIQAENMANPINKVLNFGDNTGLSNMPQNSQNLQNLKVQSSLPQNILYQKPILPQQSKYFTYYQNQYSENYPTLQVKNQFLNQNGLGYNQISPYNSYFSAKYNNGQNMFTDNTKQGNYGGQLIDFNRLLGEANLGKLNIIPNKNGIVELTYILKRPNPVYEPQYYVKYRLPYQTFLYNLQNLLVKKPNLRNQPNLLYQDLLMGSNVTDTSKDLKGLNYADILKLTSTNGTLVTAKILENNDTVVDQTLKIVQKLNSELPVENIINLNATKNIRLETQKNMNANNNSSDVNNNLLNNVNVTIRKGIYPSYPYNTFGQYPSRLQANPYSVYQTKAAGYLGIPFLKYGAALPSANLAQYPLLKVPYVGNNLQLGRFG